MLFNFTLDPIDEIQPWGEPPDLFLKWYGLSCGTYFLQAGPHQVLRYSDAALQFLARDNPMAACQPHVDYNVARLVLDIFEQLPSILEPIPDELIQYARSEFGLAWSHRCRYWIEQQAEDRAEAWNTYLAADFRNLRMLDTGYLSPDANVWFWRHGDVITISWDNRDRKFGEIPAWAELLGQYELPVEEFIKDLDAFRVRFLAAMRERVEAVRRSWSRPAVRIDSDELLNEQVHWEEPAENLSRHTSPTDWSAVMRAIDKIAGS